jgi:hypothetical protein
MRVQLFSDFANSSELRNAFRSWGNGTQYKNMEIVDDDNYTHAVIINYGRPSLKVPKENILGLMHEPFEILNPGHYLDYIKDNIGTYICHDKSKYPDWPCFKEWIPFLPPWIWVKDSPDFVEKKFQMSIVASEKQSYLGHQLRHEIIRRILRTNLDIHIFGNAGRMYGSDSRIKGRVPNKSDCLLPYNYTIAIENTSYKYYVSEKFYDPLLCNCIPIYWGASEVSKVFTNKSHIDITNASLDAIMDTIIHIYKNGNVLNKDFRIAKDLFKGERNIAHFLWEQFNKEVK